MGSIYPGKRPQDERSQRLSVAEGAIRVLSGPVVPERPGSVASNKLMVDKLSILRNEFYCLTINDVERKKEPLFKK